MEIGYLASGERELERNALRPRRRTSQGRRPGGTSDLCRNRAQAEPRPEPRAGHARAERLMTSEARPERGVCPGCA